MRLGRLTVVLAMVLSFGLAASLPVLAAPGDTPQSLGKTPRQHRPRDKGVSEYMLFSVDAEKFRNIESADMVEVARQMYQLDASSTAAVEAVVKEIQDARWRDNEETAVFSKLLTTRADLCRKILKGGDLEEGTAGAYRRLMQDESFAVVQKEIRGFERIHPHRFCDYTEQLEAVLDAGAVQKAHRNWRDRGKLLSRNIQARGLLTGLMAGPGGKQVKKGEPKEQAMRPPDRPAAPPQAKPPAAKTPDREAAKQTAKVRSPVKTERPAKQESSRKTSAEQDKKTSEPKNARRQKPAPQPRARPLNEWERYVRDFIQEHDLTNSQRNAALSILRDLTFRADQTERYVRPRLQEAEGISDRQVRQERIAALRQPLDDLFRQLQRRLDGLLTARQRIKATPAKRK